MDRENGNFVWSDSAKRRETCENPSRHNNEQRLITLCIPNIHIGTERHETDYAHLWR